MVYAHLLRFTSNTGTNSAAMCLYGYRTFNGDGYLKTDSPTARRGPLAAVAAELMYRVGTKALNARLQAERHA